MSASSTFLPARHRLLVAAVALALLASLLPAAAFPVRAADTSVFINEIHYDNTGTDAGEAIEVAGPAGADLTGWSIVLYNGATGAAYDTDALTGTIPNQSNGFGTVSFSYPVNGIQNGEPDGIALVNPSSSVVQFLSYEGTFTAVGGVANGMLSTDIGVSENGTEPLGRSLQLQGNGTFYENFTWAALPIASTFGAVNTGQTFLPSINLTINSVSRAEGNSGTSSMAFTISLNNPAGPGGVTFDIATADGTATIADNDYATNSLTGQAIPEGSSTYQFSVVVNGDIDVEPDEQFLVNVSNATGVATVTDGQGVGTIQNDDFGCGLPATFIHDIQGSGAATPIPGVRTIEGVVVGDYQSTDPAATQFGGYFVQEEDGDRDLSPLTSEGIFVFNTTTAVSVGDVVRVTGTAGEFSGMTQLSAVTATAVCSSGSSVSTTNVTLPVAAVSDLESYEGMQVTFTQELTVTEVFTLARFGEVALSVGGRLETPTNAVAPGAPAQALQSLNDRSRILLDDGINTPQNIDPTLYPQGGLSATNTLRVGDSLPSLTGVLEFRFGVYRVQPIILPEFTHSNPRTAGPEPVGGDVQVAAFNVLNYFNGNGTGLDGAAGGFPTARGANNLTEFNRQRDKIISAITGLDADVVGLMELENDSTAGADVGAIEDLVAGLNDATAPGTWDFIDTGVVGGDAIRVGLIYRPANVVPVGSHAIIDSSVDARFVDTLNRPSILQTFATTSGTRFSVLVNHLKSKSAPCGAEPDTGDGQGCWNPTRTNAALAIVDWLATDPTGSEDPDVIIIGDLNAYAKEDPITVFRNAGYVDTIDEHLDGDGYSFVFQGQSGYLDHALASPSLAAQVSGVTEWHINADEPIALDYNLEFKSANHQTTLYDPGPYRSSDHDPVLVGLELPDAPTIAVTAGISCAPAGDGGSFALTVGDDETAAGSLTLSVTGNTNPILVPNGDVTFGGSGADRTVSISHAAKRTGTAVLTIGVSDGTTTTTVSITVRIGTGADEVLVGTTGADLILGGQGTDSISGLAGADVLCGGNGDDSLSGGQGNDALGGEKGADTLTGGADADAFSGGQGGDVATDFNAGDGDTSDGT